MDKNQTQLIREQIITEAKKLIGVPFRHMGVTRHGVDCRGFCWLSYYRAGIEGIPQNDGRSYECNWFYFVDKERYLDFLLKYFDYTTNPEKADLVTFKCFSNIVTHAGIYLGNGSFIHAPSNRKVKVENLDHRYWSKKFHAFLIYKGFKKDN